MSSAAVIFERRPATESIHECASPHEKNTHTTHSSRHRHVSIVSSRPHRTRPSSTSGWRCHPECLKQRLDLLWDRLACPKLCQQTRRHEEHRRPSVDEFGALAPPGESRLLYLTLQTLILPVTGQRLQFFVYGLGVLDDALTGRLVDGVKVRQTVAYRRAERVETVECEFSHGDLEVVSRQLALPLGQRLPRIMHHRTVDELSTDVACELLLVSVGGGRAVGQVRQPLDELGDADAWPVLQQPSRHTLTSKTTIHLRQLTRRRLEGEQLWSP
mmetsp:Transcript_39433/g.98700  ORF Transcript_39433/g.98700 Transcript_39433/m.98700 type:complete len:272 (-) Transcript_39433:239-1054(-)